MKAVIIFNILFLTFFGNLKAGDRDAASQSIEEDQLHRGSGSYKGFFPDYYDLNSDYQLKGNNPFGGMPENQYPVFDNQQININSVSDYIPVIQKDLDYSLLVNNIHIADNFLADLNTNHFSRPDPFAGLIHLAHSSDSGNNPPSLKKPAVKNIIPAIAGLAYVSFIFDEQVNTFARDNQTSFLKSVAHYTDIGGEKKIVVPGLILTYGAARFLLKNEKLQTTSLNSIQSVIVTAIATESVKNLAGRARPFTNEGPYTFNPFPGSSDQYKSLPSGHASLAFSLFTPFAETYSRWIYLVPVSVAAGRVYQDKHWLSDVVTGGGIGLVSGLLFTHYENITIIPNGLRIYF